MILQSKKIPFESVDIAASQDEKLNMRMIANNPTALPPQICNGEKYCGVSSFRALLLNLVFDSCSIS